MVAVYYTLLFAAFGVVLFELSASLGWFGTEEDGYVYWYMIVIPTPLFLLALQGGRKRKLTAMERAVTVALLFLAAGFVVNTLANSGTFGLFWDSLMGRFTQFSTIQ